MTTLMMLLMMMLMLMKPKIVAIMIKNGVEGNVFKRIPFM